MDKEDKEARELLDHFNSPEMVEFRKKIRTMEEDIKKLENTMFNVLNTLVKDITNDDISHEDWKEGLKDFSKNNKETIKEALDL